MCFLYVVPLSAQMYVCNEDQGCDSGCQIRAAFSSDQAGRKKRLLIPARLKEVPHQSFEYKAQKLEQRSFPEQLYGVKTKLESCNASVNG